MPNMDEVYFRERQRRKTEVQSAKPWDSDKPYVQYFSNKRAEGEQERKAILEEAREQGYNVSITPTTRGPTLHYYPKGKTKGIQSAYFNPTSIDKFLFKLQEDL